MTDSGLQVNVTQLRLSLRRVSHPEAMANVPPVQFSVDEEDVAGTLAQAVSGFEDQVLSGSGGDGGSPGKRKKKGRGKKKRPVSTASLDSVSSVGSAISGQSIGGTPGPVKQPKALAQTLKEVKKDPHVQAIFNDELVGAFKMVYLGNVDMPEKGDGSLESCTSDDLLEFMVTNSLHKVMMAGNIARKVTLVCSLAQVAIVDRVHHNDIIVKYKTSELAYHGLKQIFAKGSKKAAASFVVFVAKSRMFSQSAFFALEGKSNWSADKIHYVTQTISMIVRETYMLVSARASVALCVVVLVNHKGRMPSQLMSASVWRPRPHLRHRLSLPHKLYLARSKPRNHNCFSMPVNLPRRLGWSYPFTLPRSRDSHQPISVPGYMYLQYTPFAQPRELL